MNKATGQVCRPAEKKNVRERNYNINKNDLRKVLTSAVRSMLVPFASNADCIFLLELNGDGTAILLMR